MKSLSQEEKETCDQTMTEKEILQSLNNLNNEKIPGKDSLPVDFYKIKLD